MRDEWWVIGQALLLAAVALLPRAGPAWPPGVAAAGPPLATAGLVLLVLGAAALGSSLTVSPRPRPGGRFVRSGVYRVIRHPMYGGVVLLAMAWAVWRMSLLHLGLAVVVAIFFDAKARREEQWLMARFPDYAGYRRAVRKLIPWVY